ncbi:MAG: c-type cytochrome domain-containing protein, partial [Ferruginibacter sp.]
MNTKFRLLAEQVLIVFNIFIGFLLLFANKLVLPYWLQPVGRLHTLMLHFPIAMLILAIGMDLFRFTATNKTNTFYNSFSRSLLLASVLLAGITVIMGLFLSREEGYSGNTMQWHKWTGAGLFFIASIIYWLRNKKWYNTPVAGFSAIVIIGSLIITGHFGATLTHGENFIMQPITATMQKPLVPLEEAIVFADIIQPILEKKCISCHNPQKLKGELALTDSLGLIKGGKSGKLFVPGNTAIGLLLERVHLPLDEEKHMPPGGKPQLTADEITLLTLWIEKEAGFNKKVISFPPDDSLRLMATAVLRPDIDSSAIFDFPPADEKLIAKLNTNYRTIAHFAKESPALDVSIYSRDAYSVKQLEELNEIKDQVISLNLNKLPVKDDDLKAISNFKNLRRVDLNFSEVTDKGLSALTSLKHLHTLSLSGTKISYNALKEKLSALKNLKVISVWNTGISSQEIASLKKEYKGVTFIEGFRNDGVDTLKLNPPQVKNSTLVFGETIPIQLRHPIRGVEIRYTMDGREPDSLQSPVFDNNTIISKNTKIKAKAFKAGWYSSDVAEFDFLKNTFIPDSVRLMYPLNSVHQAEGAHTFFDTRLGVFGANNPAWANFWGGVRDNDMGLVSVFYKPITLSSVGLHYMVEEETGIYPPDVVEIWGGENEHQLKLLATIKPPLPKKKEKILKIAEASFKPHTVSYLKIIAKP